MLTNLLLTDINPIAAFDRNPPRSSHIGSSLPGDRRARFGGRQARRTDLSARSPYQRAGGHAGIAVLHQAFGAPVIAEMRSLRPERSVDSKRLSQTAGRS